MNIKELRKITNRDKFTEMPLSTQAYYVHLAMNAYKNNFVRNPKALLRALEADDEEIEILEHENYIIKNDDYGITLNNYRG